jgi:hypothetical protein
MPAPGAPLPGELADAPATDAHTPARAAPEPAEPPSEAPRRARVVPEPAAPEAAAATDWMAPSGDLAPDQRPALAPEPDPQALQAVQPAVAVEPTQVQPVLEPGAPMPPQAPPASWDAPGSEPLAPLRPAPAHTAESGADPVAGVLGLLGGAALAAGSFMAWAKAGGTLAGGSVNGLTGSNGWGTLITGIVIAAAGVLLLLGRRKWWVGGAMVGAALVAAGLVVFSILDIGSTSDDLPAKLLAETDPPIAADVANGAVLDLDVGIWVAAAGAAVGLLAGIVAVLRRD